MNACLYCKSFSCYLILTSDVPNRLVASKVTSVMREAGGVLVVLLPSRRRKSGCDLYRRRPCNLHSFSLVWCAGVHICAGCVGRDFNVIV